MPGGDETPDLERLHAQAAAQMESIHKEQDESDLIGALEPPSALLPFFENADKAGFADGIRNYLSLEFSGVRRVRGDGNCFYRAFLFSYLENVVTGLNGKDDTVVTKSYVELQRFKGIVQESPSDLVAMGYSEVAFETFFDVFVDLLDRVSSMDSVDDLVAEFSDGEDGEGQSDYYVWYMRLLTACRLKQNAERFTPFLDDGTASMDDFCTRCVEPMKQECEHLQITALTEYLDVETHIHYLDGQPCPPGAQLTVHKFQEKEHIPDTMFRIIRLHLLYRPGHYDVLTKKA